MVCAQCQHDVLTACPHWWAEGHHVTMWQYLLGPGGRLGSSFCHCFHRLRGKHTSRGNKELPTLPGDALKSLGLQPSLNSGIYCHLMETSTVNSIPVFFFLTLGNTHSGIQTWLELWASFHGHQEQNATGDDQPYLWVPLSYQSVSIHVRTLPPSLRAFAMSTKEFRALPLFWASWYF